MTFFKKSAASTNRGLSEAFLVTAGICVFAIFIHRDSRIQIVSFSGLVLIAGVITRSVQDFPSLFSAFGIIPIRKEIFSYILAGLLFGATGGMLYNFLNEYSIVPSSLTKFAITAPLIGIVEELVFRGYVQTKTVLSGTWFSIIYASSGHTLYKYLVIKTSPVGPDINYPALLIVTFFSGIFFGILRIRSGNVIPPAVGHAIFDIVVYGALAVAPVWIWG